MSSPGSYWTYGTIRLTYAQREALAKWGGVHVYGCTHAALIRKGLCRVIHDGTHIALTANGVLVAKQIREEWQLTTPTRLPLIEG